MADFRHPHPGKNIANALSGIGGSMADATVMMEENQRAVEDRLGLVGSSLNAAFGSVDQSGATSGTKYVSSSAVTAPGSSGGGFFWITGLITNDAQIAAGDQVTVSTSPNSSGASPTIVSTYTVTSQDKAIAGSGATISFPVLTQVFVAGTSLGYVVVEHNGAGTPHIGAQMWALLLVGG